MGDSSRRDNRTRTNQGIDDLFDYDVGIDDILKSIDSSTNGVQTQSVPQPAPIGPTASLGLDEEVKVSRKRQPVAKLDEARLLSSDGIPKLSRTARSKLKFKGKGHEFSDASRLLGFYQLWLDDLFPRAKFSDGLNMIEKLGHSKRIQIKRREWISKGRASAHLEDNDNQPSVSSSERPPLSGDTAANPSDSNSGSEEQAPEKERSSDDRVSMANVTSLFGQQSTNPKSPDDRPVVLDEELFYSTDEDFGKRSVTKTIPNDDIGALHAPLVDQKDMDSESVDRLLREYEGQHEPTNSFQSEMDLDDIF